MTSDPFAPSKPPPQEYLDVVDKLFDHYRRWFGAKVSDNKRFDGVSAILWADYLASKNASLDEMRQAFVASKSLDFPPQNARDFLNLARKNRHMDSDTAFAIAIDTVGKIQAGANITWDNPAIYETVMRIGFYAMTHDHAYNLDPKWAKTYQAVCDEMDNGAVFVIPVVPLLEEKHIPCTKEQSDVHFAKLKEIIKQGYAERLKGKPAPTNPLVDMGVVA